ncbi:MAG TPA: D-alanyl-D-alanine carboxypeptidase [Pyrinomonadaceae bacterium]|nr:D-alanyl-D-alanine carboxypeptidase [Pyrinomonadaceae bacterium]
MSAHKQVWLMSVGGLALVSILSFVPYSISLSSRAGQPATAVVTTEAAPAIADVPAPPSARVAEFDVATWYATRGEEPEPHGVLIESLDGARVYASHNADTGFNPASLIKLATSLVALRRLGTEHRFETRVFINGTIESTGTLRGKIHVAGDDPTFGDVAASMIARELRARGINKITDGIVVTPRFCFNFSDVPEESGMRLARVMRFAGTETRIEVDAVTPTGTPAFVFLSYPLRDLLLYMNAHSSNFVAERLGDLVGGPEGVGRFLIDELKLEPEQVRLATASGRQSNSMTPRGLLSVIRALHTEAQRHGLKLEDIMPIVSGDYGTLRGRWRDTPLGGAAVGKTGTLPIEYDGGMASLGGVVFTKDAGAVVFVVLDRGGNIWENRQLEDELLSEVLTTLDSPVPLAIETPRQILPPSSLQIAPETVDSEKKGEGRRQKAEDSKAEVSGRKAEGSGQKAAGSQSEKAAKRAAGESRQKAEGNKQKAAGSKQQAAKQKAASSQKKSSN